MTVRESSFLCRCKPNGAAALPPLDPAVTRSSAYGFLVYPGRIELTVSYGLNAHSAMFDFASTIAPASFTRLTRNASFEETNPFIASDPAALCKPIVSKLSLTMIGTQCKGPTGPDVLNRRSRSSACSSACWLISTSALNAGPFLSYASIRRRYCSTSAWHVSRLLASSNAICAIDASET